MPTLEATVYHSRAVEVWGWVPHGDGFGHDCFSFSFASSELVAAKEWEINGLREDR